MKHQEKMSCNENEEGRERLCRRDPAGAQLMELEFLIIN